MTRCYRCGREAPRYHITYMRRSMCGDCFVSFYERKVKNAYIKYGMYRVGRRVGVAVSGGKDSLALLSVLKRVFPHLSLTAIYLNLGIGGYSDESERVSRKLCDELGVDLIIYRLDSSEGFVVPDFRETAFRKRMCGVCGTVKRYLLNKVAYENGLEVIATGHNLDDTVEVLFELYLRGNLEEAARLKPVLVSNHPKMASRIKPLIEMTDEEDLYYVDALGIEYASSWCPLVKGSRMMNRKMLIKQIEEKIPGYRHLLFKSHVKKILPKLEQLYSQPALNDCELCGMPTTARICSYCKVVKRVRRAEDVEAQ